MLCLVMSYNHRSGNFLSSLAFFFINKARSCLITGMRAIAASFPGPRVMPRDPKAQQGLWVSRFTPRWSRPQAGPIGRWPPSRSSPGGLGISHMDLRSLPPPPYRACDGLCLGMRANLSEDMLVWTRVLRDFWIRHPGLVQRVPCS